MILPSKKEVIEKLNSLIKKERSREEIANWAAKFLLDDSWMEHRHDEKAWKGINMLAGADMIVNPNSEGDDKYLHSQIDFKEWFEELNDD